MSYEDRMARQVDSNRRRHTPTQESSAAVRPLIPEDLPEDIRILAREYSLRRDEEMLSMEDPYFTATKNAAKLASDKAEVRRLEGKFNEKDDETLLASAFEQVIARRLNGPSHWLGEHMRAQLTAPFDDYVNKVDLYVEDIRGESAKPIGLSVDVTFSRSRSAIEGKIRDVKHKLLDGGRLAQLHYYKPLGEKDGGPASGTISLPKVIVGIDRPRAIESLKNLAAAEKANSEADNRDWMTGIAILYQMNEQLKAYRWYSKERVNAREKPHVAATIARYEEVLADIESVFQTMNFDYAKVREFAEKNIVTQIIEQKLSEELGYRPGQK